MLSCLYTNISTDQAKFNSIYIRHLATYNYNHKNVLKSK